MNHMDCIKFIHLSAHTDTHTHAHTNAFMYVWYSMQYPVEHSSVLAGSCSSVSLNIVYLSCPLKSVQLVSLCVQLLLQSMCTHGFRFVPIHAKVSFKSTASHLKAWAWSYLSWQIAAPDNWQLEVILYVLVVTSLQFWSILYVRQ